MALRNFDYLEYRLDELADLVLLYATTPQQRAFGKLLKNCAAGAIALSSVLEGNDSPGFEVEALNKVVGPAKVLESVVEDAHEMAKTLAEELEKACLGSCLVSK